MATMYGMARLGRDAELRYTPDGKPVASLSLAFNYGRKGQDGKQPVQWVDAALWDKRAESLSPHLLKGTKIMVTLRDVHIETFRRSDGADGHKLAAVVTDVEFAGGAQSDGAAPAPAPRATPAPRPPQRQAAAPATGTGFDDMDDDIPF